MMVCKAETDGRISKRFGRREALVKIAFVSVSESECANPSLPKAAYAVTMGSD